MNMKQNALFQLCGTWCSFIQIFILKWKNETLFFCWGWDYF